MFDWALDFINSFFSNLWELIKFALESILSTLWEIIKFALDALLNGIATIFFLIWDGFLTIVSNLVSTLDLSALAFTQIAQWSDLPPQLIYLINQLALPQCASIIGSSILIRMTLNIIPTWATRV